MRVSEIKLYAHASNAEIENVLSRDGAHSLTVPASLSTACLVRIIASMRQSAFSKAFLELLAAAPIVEDVVWRAVLQEPVDAEVAMTALGNRMVPRDVVLRFLGHPSPQVPPLSG